MFASVCHMSPLKGDYLSVREASEILDMTEAGVRYHCDRGNLTKWVDGRRRVRLKTGEVLALKSRRETLRLVA